MLYRLYLDLAFKDKTDMDTIIEAVKKVKSRATKTKVGKDSEEHTTRATWHECWHDDPFNPKARPCNETEREI